MYTLVFSTLAALVVVPALVRGDTARRVKVFIWVLFSPAVFGTLALWMIHTFAPTLGGTAQYDPAGYWFSVRVWAFGGIVLAIPLSLVSTIVLGLDFANRRNRQSGRPFAASCIIAVDTILCGWAWVSSGAFPSA